MFSKVRFKFGKFQKSPVKQLNPSSPVTTFPMVSKSTTLEAKDNLVVSDKPEEPANSSDTDSSLMDFQNAKNTTNYAGEIVYGSKKLQKSTKSDTVSSGFTGSSENYINKRVPLEFPLLSPPETFNIKNQPEDYNTNKKNQVRFEDETLVSEVDEDITDRKKVPKKVTENEEKIDGDQKIEELNGIENKEIINGDENRENIYDSYDRNYEKYLSNNFINSQNNGENDVVSDLKDEIGRLRYIVHKLNSQLVIYQNEYGAISYDEENDGFPLNGPTPPWLVSSKQLVPLLMAYEEKIAQADKILLSYKDDILSLKKEILEVLNENSRLHNQIEQASISNTKPVSMTHLKHLKEQCALVLEENQLLINQMSLQKQKVQFYATKVENEAIQFQKSKKELQLENERLKKEKKELLEELEHSETNNKEEIEDKIKKKFNKEMLELSEKIKNFELRMEEITKLKEANEKENEDLIRSLVVTENEKKKAFELVKGFKKKNRFLKGCTSKLLNFNYKQKDILNSLLTKTESTVEERNALLSSNLALSEEKKVMFDKWKRIDKKFKIAKKKNNSHLYKRQKKISIITQKLKLQEKINNVLNEKYEKVLKSSRSNF